MAEIPRPLCFVAMPFGCKPFEEGGKEIDFDKIYEAIRQGVEQADIECQRADFDPSGGFIHRSMFEALVVAEFVVADLTLANPNVTYEIGVRHGVGQRNTMLVCADSFIDKLPFDFGPLRTSSYRLDADLKLTDEAAADLTKNVHDQLKLLTAGELPGDNPILQVTGLSRQVSHEKADLFVKRLEYAGKVGEEVRKALILKDAAEAISRLEALQEDLFQTSKVVPQLHSALMAIYLGYREKKAYQKMLDLYERLPRELQNATVVLEQLSLAYNRLAEAAEEVEQKDKASELRKEALHIAARVSEHEITSETYGIMGRIHKAQYDAFSKAGEKLKAEAALLQAIGTYEKGLLNDPRDYYPGVNAITLRVISGTADDETRLKRILPVVRFALERAPEPEDDYEKYWHVATQLEVACAERDWNVARKHLLALIPIDCQDWMRETTIDNLKLQKRARSGEEETVNNLDEYINDLSPE